MGEGQKAKGVNKIAGDFFGWEACKRVSFFIIAEMDVSNQIVVQEVSQGVAEMGEAQPSPALPPNDDTPQRASNRSGNYMSHILYTLRNKNH